MMQDDLDQRVTDVRIFLDKVFEDIYHQELGPNEDYSREFTAVHQLLMDMQAALEAREAKQMSEPARRLGPSYWTGQIAEPDRNALSLLYGGEAASPLTDEEKDEMSDCGC